MKYIRIQTYDIPADDINKGRVAEGFEPITTNEDWKEYLDWKAEDGLLWEYRYEEISIISEN
jgi:hypothetical protein